MRKPPRRWTEMQRRGQGHAEQHLPALERIDAKPRFQANKVWGRSPRGPRNIFSYFFSSFLHLYYIFASCCVALGRPTQIGSPLGGSDFSAPRCARRRLGATVARLRHLLVGEA